MLSRLCLAAFLLVAPALGQLLRFESIPSEGPAPHDTAAAARREGLLRGAGALRVETKRWRGWNFVPMRVNGRVVAAGIDTGAPRNALSGPAALETGLARDEETFGFVRARIGLGGTELGPFTVRIEDRPARARRPALLGMPTLQAFGAVLDCARGQLWISPRAPRALGEALAAGGGLAPLPLLRSADRDRLYAPAVLNGVRGFFIVDTGVANTTLTQSAGAATRIAWVSRPDKVSVDYRGREHPVYMGQAASFTLGGVPVPSVSLVRRDQTMLEYVAADAPEEWGQFFGLLGNDVLERLEAVIDCAGGRVMVARRARR